MGQAGGVIRTLEGHDRKLCIETAAVGQARVMGLREGGPLLVQPPRLLHDGGRLAEQDRIARQAEDKIRQAPMSDHLNDLWGREMTVSANEDMGPWPVAPQIGQESDQDHGVFRAGRMRPRTEAGGPQRVRGPLENEQRKIAIVLVVMVIERKFLLAMRRVIGVIEVKHNSGWGLWIARDEVIDQRLREPVEVLAVDAVFKPRKGRRTRQVLLWSQWKALHT